MNELKKTLVLATAWIGILLTAFHAMVMARFLLAGVTAIGNHPDDIRLAGYVTGELIVGICVSGIYAIVAAVPLYFAIAPLRLRRPWFYHIAFLCAKYYLLLLPVGTIAGVLLIRALRKRKDEFFPLGEEPVGKEV